MVDEILPPLASEALAEGMQVSKTTMFDRFQDQPKRILRAAREEALALGHDTIRTVHVLLGLVRAAPELAERAMPAISIDAVRREVEARTGKGVHRGAGPMPFTPNAKKVLELTMHAAIAAGSPHIGSHHLLLGLVGATDGSASEILVDLGFPRESVEQRVHELSGSELTGAGATETTIVRLARACGSADPLRLGAMFELCASGLGRTLDQLPAAAHEAVRRLPATPDGARADHWRLEIPPSHWSGVAPRDREALAAVVEVLRHLVEHSGDAQASANLGTLRASLE